jgi:hypothetical protein
MRYNYNGKWNQIKFFYEEEKGGVEVEIQVEVTPSTTEYEILEQGLLKLVPMIERFLEVGKSAKPETKNGFIVIE